MTLSHGAVDFIDDAKLTELVRNTRANRAQCARFLAKSLCKQSLEPSETAALLAAEDPDDVQEIFAAARQLKRDVYGNRIVIFAPLYIGNHCVNDCAYCSFKRSNREQVRRTLSSEEIKTQVREMEHRGHKRA